MMSAVLHRCTCNKCENAGKVWSVGGDRHQQGIDKDERLRELTNMFTNINVMNTLEAAVILT